jgi:hypothetical protein
MVRLSQIATRRRYRDERGAIAILVAVVSLVLFVTAALVIDLGLARDTRRQAQNAADASALAAANALFPMSGNCEPPGGGTAPCFDDAVAAAKDYAAENYGVQPAAWSGCSDSSSLSHTPESDCISFDSSTSPNKVRVLIPTRNVKTGLGELAEVSSIPVAADAVASIQRSAAVNYALFAISDSCGDKTLEINGNQFTVTGSVHSNDDAKINGSTIAIDGSLHVVGTSYVDPGVVVDSSTSGPPPKPDPLNPDGSGERIELWRPGSARATALGSKYHDMGNAVVTSFDVQTRGEGVYYTTDSVNLSSGLPLANVTFVIDRAVGEPVFFANGNNIAISHYVDPVNNPNEVQVITNAKGGLAASDACDKAVVHINGNDFRYEGAIYAPNGRVHLNGDDHQSADGSIIAYTLKINGNDAGVANDVDLAVGGADIALLE